MSRSKNKIKIKDIKYLGRINEKDVWGNDGAEKIIQWLHTCLDEEIDKNMKLEAKIKDLEKIREKINK